MIVNSLFIRRMVVMMWQQKLGDLATCDKLVKALEDANQGFAATEIQKTISPGV